MEEEARVHGKPTEELEEDEADEAVPDHVAEANPGAEEEPEEQPHRQHRACGWRQDYGAISPHTSHLARRVPPCAGARSPLSSS